MNRGASASCFSYWLWNQVSVGLINVHLFVSVILVSLHYSGRETPVTEKKSTVSTSSFQPQLLRGTCAEL